MSDWNCLILCILISIQILKIFPRHRKILPKILWTKPWIYWTTFFNSMHLKKMTTPTNAAFFVIQTRAMSSWYFYAQSNSTFHTPINNDVNYARAILSTRATCILCLRENFFEHCRTKKKFHPFFKHNFGVQTYLDIHRIIKSDFECFCYNHIQSLVIK